MALPLGEILDRKFKIVKVLGEGGMGTVYQVELLDRPGNYCAVKELLINPSTNVEERNAAIERFNKEIDLLFGLKHPRIPSFMLSFQERGNYYFVMEFVPGQSLDRKLEENNAPLNEEDVIKWMMQVCEALAYIHSRNPPIILRDLKPGNVMLTTSGDVQLIDFGIARRFDPNKRTNTDISARLQTVDSGAARRIRENWYRPMPVQTFTRWGQPCITCSPIMSRTPFRRLQQGVFSRKILAYVQCA